MKKDLKVQKLTLTRETIQSLDTERLPDVAGGATIFTSCGVRRTCTC